jgi:tRNA threonylcarbamoyladenosine biosynthesis protein TsaE
VNRDPFLVEIVTRSPGETRALGAVIASLVNPGDVVLLIGELGSGKTVLTKGLVAALGGGESTTSPTFVLCHVYPTTPPVAHVDCYRLEPGDDLDDLALDEALEDGSVLVVEWGERLGGRFGAEALSCAIGFGADGESAKSGVGEDTARVIVLTSLGEVWTGRGAALIERLERAGLTVVGVRSEGGTRR